MELVKNINNFQKVLLRSSGNKDFDDLIQKLIEKDIEKRLNWKEYFEHPFFANKKKIKFINDIEDENKNVPFLEERNNIGIGSVQISNQKLDQSPLKALYKKQTHFFK